MSIRWADYSPLTSLQLWGLIGIVDSGFVALGLAIAFLPIGRSTPDPAVGVSAAVLGPVLLTAGILWLSTVSLNRLGISNAGLVLVYPKRSVHVAWSDLLPPVVGYSKSGYFLESRWKGSSEVSSFTADRMSTKYILEHPTCPKLELPTDVARTFQMMQSVPWSTVKVHIEPEAGD